MYSTHQKTELYINILNHFNFQYIVMYCIENIARIANAVQYHN